MRFRVEIRRKRSLARPARLSLALGRAALRTRGWCDASTVTNVSRITRQNKIRKISPSIFRGAETCAAADRCDEKVSFGRLSRPNGRSINRAEHGLLCFQIACTTQRRILVSSATQSINSPFAAGETNVEGHSLTRPNLFLFGLVLALARRRRGKP